MLVGSTGALTVGRGVPLPNKNTLPVFIPCIWSIDLSVLQASALESEGVSCSLCNRVIFCRMNCMKIFEQNWFCDISSRGWYFCAVLYFVFFALFFFFFFLDWQDLWVFRPYPFGPESRLGKSPVRCKASAL